MIDVVKNQVVIVDGNDRGYFVDKLADGTGYGVFFQDKNWKAARLVNSPSFNKEGYLDPQKAFNDLTCWLACREGNWSTRTYFVNGQRYSREAFNEICAGKRELPAEVEPMALVRLQDIEYRIAHHMNGAYQEFLAVGRCLNEAKEAQLVPHGQWEAWVKRNTGMTERQAQRLMQAARLAAPGSAMEKLPLSKITALLLAPEEQREALAEKALKENTSVRVLREEVALLREQLGMARGSNDRMRRERDEEVRKALEKARTKHQEELDAKDQAAAAQMDEMRRRLNTQAVEMEQVQAFAQARVEEIQTLKARSEGGGISREAQRRIDQLEKEVEEAEAYAAQQAQARQEAQRELLDLQAQAVRGGVMAESEEFDLGVAVRTFMGVAGVMPHMGSTLAALPEGKRQELNQYVDMIDTWVQGARKALGMVLVAND
ncbi:MAG: DUF3102 domain-containing protein [Clostridia bacterium]|nr:DUF3102 domain-containing protein [Clostridia bacterium]